MRTMRQDVIHYSTALLNDIIFWCLVMIWSFDIVMICILPHVQIYFAHVDTKCEVLPNMNNI